MSRSTSLPPHAPRKRLHPLPPARYEAPAGRTSDRGAGSAFAQVTTATASYPEIAVIPAWAAVDDAYGSLHRLHSP